MTFHRAQELTLDCVNCNIDGLFARGQLLVGLSRARDFKHLRARVSGTLSGNLVCQSPEAIAFELEAAWTLIVNSPSGYSAMLAAG